MNLESHLNSLNDKHHALENTITEERQRPNPDQVRLTALKRQKLRIKEEIAQLQH